VKKEYKIKLEKYLKEKGYLEKKKKEKDGGGNRR